MDPNNGAVTSSQPQISGTSPISLSPKINWIISVVFLILGILIGAFGFWVYQNYLVKKTPVSTESSLTSTPLPTEAPAKESDPTANWKTYTDPQRSFSFKYPSIYIVNEKAPGYLVVNSQTDSAPQAGISIDARIIGPYENYSGSEKYLRTSFIIDKEYEVEDWHIFNTTGKDGMLIGVKFKTAIAKFKAGAIVVEALNNPNSEYVMDFDQILSTFKFVGQGAGQNIDDVFNKIRTADSTISWSTVTSTDTFRYPAQNGTDLSVQKINFTAIGKEDFNKVNKIVNTLKNDGWELDNNGSASGVGASYESYTKNIKGVNYLLVFGFNNSNIWFAMSKI